MKAMVLEFEACAVCGTDRDGTDTLEAALIPASARLAIFRWEQGRAQRK